MSTFLWFLSFISSIFAIYSYFISDTVSAVQQAALAGMTLVIVILPYCLAKAGTELFKLINPDEKAELEGRRITKSNSLPKDKLTDVVRSLYDLQKLDLIYKATQFNSQLDITYEIVSERIEFLKLLLVRNIISNDEFEQLKNKLLTLLKNKLNEELKP